MPMRTAAAGRTSHGSSLWPFPSTEATGPPRFLGNPCVHVPRSSTPAGRERSTDFRAHGVAFRTLKNVGPTTIPLCRSSMTRPMHTLSTLRPRGYPRGTPDSLPAASAKAWPDGIALPAGSQCKVSNQVMIILLAQASPGALKGDGPIQPVQAASGIRRGATRAWRSPARSARPPARASTLRPVRRGPPS